MDILTDLKHWLGRIWCRWLLYSRLPQRILYHTGKKQSSTSFLLGKLGGMYVFFEAACWLLISLIFFGHYFSIDFWLTLYMPIVLIIAIKDWRIWVSRGDNYAIADCNKLRDQGCWYPEWMTRTDKKCLLWALFFFFLQMILTPIIAVVALALFT